MDHDHYLVMTLNSKPGIGTNAGAKLLASAEKRTFGSLLKELTGKGVVKDNLAARLKTALDDRNWLVHRSRRDNHSVLESDERCAKLIAKVDQISNNALTLMKELGDLVERLASEVGVSKEFIERESERLLIEWGISE